MSAVPKLTAGPLARARAVTSSNLPLAFMLVVLGVYLLTMSGHTYSRDEETMLEASRTLVTRGTWVMSRDTNLVQVRGVNEHLYSQYGPGQALAAVPWTAAGLLMGKLFPNDQAGFVLRLVDATFDVLMASGIVGLFAALGLGLGYSRKASLFTAGSFAFATFLWPHSRTFFSETLVALCLFASFYLVFLSTHNAPQATRRADLLLALSGALFALAVATKVQYVVALPAFQVYVWWRVSNTMSTPRQTVGLSAWWAGGLLVGLVPLLVYNYTSFGNVFTTGYGTDLRSIFTYPLAEGLYGLLLSPGKGIVWYALPVLLTLWGLPRFARKFKAEALLFALVALPVLTLFALYPFWHGDGSWGPRYLVPVLPLMMLPSLQAVKSAIESHREWGRVALAVLVGLGFSINLLGVLVNFDTYINSGYNDEARHFTLEAAPIFGHARLLYSELHRKLGFVDPGDNSVVFKHDFSYSEGNREQGELLPRWTIGRAALDVWPSPADTPVTVTLRLSDHRPPMLPRASVAVLVDGERVEGLPVPGSPVSTDYAFSINTRPTHVVINSDTWNPLEVGQSNRDEQLGVRVDSFTISKDGQVLDYRFLDDLDPPPYFGSAVWYYDPNSHFTLDLWPVYMAATGMGKKAMLALGLPIVALSLLCVALGLLGLHRPRRR